MFLCLQASWKQLCLSMMQQQQLGNTSSCKQRTESAPFLSPPPHSLSLSPLSLSIHPSICPPDCSLHTVAHSACCSSCCSVIQPSGRNSSLCFASKKRGGEKNDETSSWICCSRGGSGVLTSALHNPSTLLRLTNVIKRRRVGRHGGDRRHREEGGKEP